VGSQNHSIAFWLWVLSLTVPVAGAMAQELPLLTDRSAESLVGLNNDVNVKSLEVGDFNADGLEEVVIARLGAAPVLLVNESGVLTNRTTDFIGAPAAASNSNYVEAFDANGDDLADLVFARLDRAPWLLINRGNDATGTWLGFEPGVSLDVANNSLVIESGDVTGDGAADLLVVEVEFGTNQLLVNDGDGSFTDQSEKLGGLGRLQRGHSALLDDADGDGDVDIIYIESDLFLYVYYNDGEGNFNDTQRLTLQNSDSFAYIFGAADFNGDGRFDFRNYSNTAPMAAISTTIDNSQGIPVYLMRQDAPMTRGNRKHGTVHMRDIDGDGDTDYVLSSMLRNFGGLENTFEGMRTEIVINAGVNSGTFIPFAGEDWSRDESMDARILDVNADGNMDLFIAHQRRYGVYLNNAPSKVVELESVTALPSAAGTAVSIEVALATGVDVEYQWDYGDGTVETTQIPLSTHVYQQPGRYLISVTARSDSGSDQITMTHRVHEPLIDGEAMSSSSIRVAGDRIWVVNPDHNSVSVQDVASGELIAEISVGTTPVNLVPLAEEIWVTNKSSASVSVISTETLQVVDEIALARGSQPHGIVNYNGLVYVALEGTGELIRLDGGNRTIETSLNIGSHPRHLAINADGSLLFAPRFITSPLAGESSRQVSTNGSAAVIVVRSGAMVVDSVIDLPYNNVEDTDSSARGIPNYLMAPALSPDGLRAFVPAKLDNIYRGSMRDGNAREHNKLVRSMMATIDLNAGVELVSSRLDFDNNSPPTAAAVGPTGNYLFVIHEGSRFLEIVDTFSGEILFSTELGFAPQGVALSADFQRLVVDNMLSRSVSVYDISGLINGATDNAELERTISTVSREVLDSQVLLGKQLFHDAQDAALTGQKYISCAVCHSEGGHDGRTWDFSDAGEGLRNTIDLRGRAGLGHGNVHWTANFDEIHDFENDIREIFDGTGLLTDEDYNRTQGTLDSDNPKAGLSERLDALAAYVTSLDTFPESPYRTDASQRSPAAERGYNIFRTANCATCHTGDEFTDSPLERFHNIGTVDADTGGRLGQALVGNGLDTPTLRGVWNGSPYLHDGSAPDLEAAVRAHRSVQVGFNVAQLTATQMSDLVEYLLQIDGDEPLATSMLDNDGDGVVNSLDNDDDNDSVPDAQDSFSLDATESRDTDGDGLGDNADTDDDNDGVPDIIEDAAPADIDGDGLANRLDLDSDGDSLPDILEAGGLDSNSDALIDGVGAEGTLLNVPDTDGDGLADLYDIESLNPSNTGAGPFDIESSRWQSLDTDNNGILNSSDVGFVDSNNDGTDDRTVATAGFKTGGGALAPIWLLILAWFVFTCRTLTPRSKLLVPLVRSELKRHKAALQFCVSHLAGRV